MNTGQLLITAIGFLTAIIVTFFLIQKNNKNHIKG
jgi:hypothetical protein